MPRYDYECSDCGHIDELTLRLTELDEEVHCTLCGGTTRRLVGNKGGFRLKGSCWSGDGYARYYGDIKE